MAKVKNDNKISLGYDVLDKMFNIATKDGSFIPEQYVVIPCFDTSKGFKITGEEDGNRSKDKDHPIVFKHSSYEKCADWIDEHNWIIPLKNEYEANFNNRWLVIRGIEYHPTRNAWAFWVVQKKGDIVLVDRSKGNIEFDDKETPEARIKWLEDKVKALIAQSKIRENRLSDLESMVCTLSNKLAEHIASGETESEITIVEWAIFRQEHKQSIQCDFINFLLHLKKLDLVDRLFTASEWNKLYEKFIS